MLRGVNQSRENLGAKALKKCRSVHDHIFIDLGPRAQGV